jgi:hypothetical protein
MSEAACSSETLVFCYKTTRCKNPGAHNLKISRFTNAKMLKNAYKHDVA